jgi:hypothetical protein
MPLVLAYVAFPLADMTTRAFGREPFRSWIDGAWLLLSLMAILQSILRLNRPFRIPRLPLGVLIASPMVLILAILPVLGTRFAGLPYAMEMKPLFYIAIAWLWVLVYGLPSRRAFIQAGLCLSAVIAAELLISSIWQRTLARPTGSGEVNYDACLIVLSLCVALTDEDTPGLISLLLFAGVLATFSRTGAIAALMILAVSRRVPKSAKLMAAGASVAVSVVSFLIRGLELDVGQIDRYLMWRSAIQLFTASPSGLIWGYGVGARLPLSSSVPGGLEDLWLSQAQNLDLSGVYAFQYHAMWLRMLITWGIIVVALLLVTLIVWTFQSRSLLRRYFALVIFLEGFSMGVIYLSNVGVPAWILLLLACRDIAPPQMLAMRRLS